MAHPLQDKDEQWRRRGNAARPIFDPGLAPPSTDEEAGGAVSARPAEHGPVDELPTEPVFQPGGPILPRRLWYAAGLAILTVLVVLALISF